MSENSSRDSSLDSHPIFIHAEAFKQLAAGGVTVSDEVPGQCQWPGLVFKKQTYTPSGWSLTRRHLDKFYLCFLRFLTS